MPCAAASSARRRAGSRRSSSLASTEIPTRRRRTRSRYRRASTNGSGAQPFLPPSPGVAEPFRLTPQLALRIAILGGIAITVFGVLFFRLWALQVLSGPQYLHAALNNQLRSVPLEARRRSGDPGNGPGVDPQGAVPLPAGTRTRLPRRPPCPGVRARVSVPIARGTGARQCRPDQPG